MSAMPKLAWADGVAPVRPRCRVNRFLRQRQKFEVWMLGNLKVMWVHKNATDKTVPCQDKSDERSPSCPLCQDPDFDRRQEGYAPVMVKNREGIWEATVGIFTSRGCAALGQGPHRGLRLHIWRKAQGTCPVMEVERIKDELTKTDIRIEPPSEPFNVEDELVRMWFPEVKSPGAAFPPPFAYEPIPKQKIEAARPIKLTKDQMISATSNLTIFESKSDEDLIDKYVSDYRDYGTESMWLVYTYSEIEKRGLVKILEERLKNPTLKLHAPQSNRPATEPMSGCPRPTSASPADSGIVDRLRRQQEQQPPVQAPPTMDEGLEFLKRVQAGTRVERLVVEESIADFEALASRRTGEILCSDQKKKMSADHPANTNGKHKREDVA